MSGWINVPSNIDDYQGFVYEIVHEPTGKYYIGMKNFWRIKKLPPLKGRKNKRHFKTPMDWQTYWGSSKEFQKFVEREGKENFRRRMLRHCKDKWELKYYELKEQVDRDVLFDPLSFNGLIQVRLGRRRNK